MSSEMSLMLWSNHIVRIVCTSWKSEYFTSGKRSIHTTCYATCLRQTELKYTAWHPQQYCIQLSIQLLHWQKYVITFYQALCGGNSVSLVANICIPVVQLSSQKYLDFSSGAIGKFHVGTWLECFHKLMGRLKIWFARCDWNATTIIILGHFCLTILSCS